MSSAPSLPSATQFRRWDLPISSSSSQPNIVELDDSQHFDPLRQAVVESSHENSVEAIIKLNTLGYHLLKSKEYEEAKTNFREALHRCHRLSGGPNSVEAATCLFGLGTCSFRQQDYKSAEVQLSVALKTWENLTPSSSEVRTCLKQLGSVEYELQKYTEAEDFFRCALEKEETSITADKFSKVDLLIRLANTLSAQDKHHEARIQFEKARAIAITTRDSELIQHVQSQYANSPSKPSHCIIS